MNCPQCQRFMPDSPVMLVEATQHPNGLISCQIKTLDGRLVAEMSDARKESFETFCHEFAECERTNLHFHWTTA